MNFQAAVTAITQTYIIRQRPLSWLKRIENDTPVSVEAETAGAGYDIALVFQNDKKCEVQVKKGLNKSARLWDSLIALSEAIDTGELDYGVIAVCPNSSGTVKNNLANDLRRIACGREDNLKSISQEYLKKFTPETLTRRQICNRLRIVVINALHDDDAHVRAAKAELEHLCDSAADAGKIWNALLQDSALIIENREKRDARNIYHNLKSIGIGAPILPDAPSQLDQQNYRNWVTETCSHFTILGLTQRATINEYWLPLNALPETSNKSTGEILSLAEAVQQYHDWDKRKVDRYTDCIDPETIGRFLNLSVLIGGPGMGKSTILKKLACIYSADGYLTLRINLRLVCARMKSEGAGFYESIFALGLDGFSGNPADFANIKHEDWVMLFDGLDECGNDQPLVLDGLKRLAAGYPSYRLIVATRPVGYTLDMLPSWRHYTLIPFDADSASNHIDTIIHAHIGNDQNATGKAGKLAKRYLATKPVKNLAIRNPLLIGLIAALWVKGREPGNNKGELFESIFSLIEEHPNERVSIANIPAATLSRSLDILGYEIISNPLLPSKDLIISARDKLAEELQCSKLRAEATCNEAIRYWSDLGIVEQLNCGLEKTVTFVHKSFAEYCAARYIHGLPTYQRHDAIQDILGKDEWVEVIPFLAALGDAEFIISKISALDGTRKARIDQTKSALDIVLNSELGNDSNAVRATIEAAIKLIDLKFRIDSCIIAETLIELAPRFPDLMSPHVSNFVTNEDETMQLIGWAILVSCGENYVSLNSLTNFIKDVMPYLLVSQLRVSLGGGMMLGSADSALIAYLVVNACALVIKTGGVSAAANLIPRSIRMREHGSMGLHTKLEVLFKDNNGEYRLPNKKIEDRFDVFESLKQHAVLRREFATKHLPALLNLETNDIAEKEEYDPPQKLYNFAAFNKFTGADSDPAYDIQSWSKDYDKNAAREVTRAFIAASGIDPDRLKDEARSYVGAMKDTDDDRIYSIDLRLPNVDLPEINWENVNLSKFDSVLIEKSMYSRSMWLRRMATYVILAITPKENLKATVKRILTKGRGYTLLLSSHLARELPDIDAVDVLSERAIGEDIYGLDHVFDMLAKFETLSIENASNLCLAGLVSKHPETAISATKLGLAHETIDDETFLSALKQAYDHWKTHEKPYPVGGGVVPRSPRAEILDLIERITPHSYNQINKFLRDDRSDVNKFGEIKLMELLRTDEVHHKKFISDIKSETIGASYLTKALDMNISFKASELCEISSFIETANPRLRYAALALLRYDGVDAEITTSLLKKAQSDPEQQIRDRAAYLSSYLE